MFVKKRMRFFWLISIQSWEMRNVIMIELHRAEALTRRKHPEHRSSCAFPVDELEFSVIIRIDLCMNDTIHYQKNNKQCTILFVKHVRCVSLTTESSSSFPNRIDNHSNQSIIRIYCIETRFYRCFICSSLYWLCFLYIRENDSSFLINFIFTQSISMLL